MVAIFAIDHYQQMELKEGASPFVQELMVFTPIQTYLLFEDFPYARAFYYALKKEKTANNLSEFSEETQTIFYKMIQMPYWHGFWYKSPQDSISYPPFTCVITGQLWRLVTPILLHSNMMHLLFNALWIYFLGRVLEKKLSLKRLFLLLIMLAAVTNIAQYLMTGPMLIGISGVVCGFAGFIWIRQRRYPWEAYPVARMGINLLFGYVILMAIIELVIEFISLMSGIASKVNIGNTAHIIGALAGILLGLQRRFWSLAK